MKKEMKMRTADQIFGKICLQAIRYNFCLICGLWPREGWGEAWRKAAGIKFLVVGDIQKKWRVQNFGNTCKKHPEESAWSTDCNDFEKNESEYFLSKQQIQSM